MRQIGIDLGTSTIKIISMRQGSIEQTWIKKHCGRVVQTVLEGLRAFETGPCTLCITGNNKEALLSIKPALQSIEDIPSVVEGVRFLVPNAGSIIEIGSQGARFMDDAGKKVPSFSVNEHCAGGTGSFFEDQMSRLGLKIDDYSKLVQQAREIPNLSGRCAVFAKTDIIHRQQEGVPKQDILLGLCYAMIRNYKATIVKGLQLKKPVVFCGGVTLNTGVRRAIRDIFSLQEDELIVPEHALFSGAVGAALRAEQETDLDALLALLEENVNKAEEIGSLERLVLTEGTDLSEPKASGEMPAEGCYLGIDIGSTSTDLVLVSREGELVDFQYLRTAGDPEGVVRKGLQKIKETYGTFPILGVGVTGSGRERIGSMMGADAVRDEITAQAKAASYFVPQADTVFEIGGQDSKYIYLKDGEVADFQMNKICAAGTGSFIEEQAARMGIAINDFGGIALSGEAPCDLGERCTVFIETAITQAEAKGASQADIAAGLCHSVVKNYLHKVVGNKKVGNQIVLQGGVDYNPGIVAAFQSAYRDKITVSPVFSISGAFGAALLAKETVGEKESTFLGFDFPAQEKKITATSEEIRRNKAFYKWAGQIVVEDYDATIDPKKKTIGVPLTLIMFKFFPMVNAFFKNLGFNVILSDATNEETIKLSQQYARGETCYPVKLIYGHMMQLAQRKVDYIFIPSVHTIRHPHANAVHSYACPYMQMAPRAIFESLGLEQQGIQLLSPVLDLELGAKMMGLAMLETVAELGFSKPRCIPGLMKGALAVNKYTSDVEKLGADMLKTVKPHEKVIVLITRNYGLYDPVLNMGIPEILLNRGYKVMTLGHLPAMSMDLSKDYPNMFWPFGDHILSGAKIIKNHPNLYAVYLTNHGCGPDTVVSHMFREEMGDKPYLQIEVDEHYSRVGVITRIEAFLNSLKHTENKPMPENFDILNVRMQEARLSRQPQKGKKLILPDLGAYTKYLAAYYTELGYDAVPMESFDRGVFSLGRAEMNSKEYLPLPALLGGAIRACETYGAENVQLLIPFNYGADADGQYARAVRTILDRKGLEQAEIVTPVLEEIAEKAENIELFFRALLTGDVVYALPQDMREKYAPQTIPDFDALLKLAKQTAESQKKGRTIAAVGTPLCLTSLNEGILDELEKEDNRIQRMPLSEMLYFLWKDNNLGSAAAFEKMENEMQQLSAALGTASPYSRDISSLFATAEQYLHSFSAANGRYRFAKAVDFGKYADAVLMLVPRYENTAMMLQLRNVAEVCKAPLFELSLDGDWDESGKSRLQSFLYYC